MATKLTLKQKQEHAFLLFTRDNITVHKELSAKTNVSPKTISKWITDGSWDKYRQNMLLTREEQMQNLLNELSQLNEAIKLKPEGFRYADSKEADVRRKLIKDIKDLETKASIAEHIGSLKSFIKWVTPINYDKAKEITLLADSFIKDCLR